MSDNYDVEALATDVAATVDKYRDDRELVEAIKPHLAR
jgi:hypothetical protein